jgi:hypothetical protein
MAMWTDVGASCGSVIDTATLGDTGLVVAMSVPGGGMTPREPLMTTHLGRAKDLAGKWGNVGPPPGFGNLRNYPTGSNLRERLHGKQALQSRRVGIRYVG